MLNVHSNLPIHFDKQNADIAVSETPTGNFFKLEETNIDQSKFQMLKGKKYVQDNERFKVCPEIEV